MSKKIRVSASDRAKAMRQRRIVAAGEDDFDLDPIDEGIDDPLGDTLDDVADTVEDIQDSVDDTSEDEVNIDIDNNIDDHYIAECEKCKNIFISAMVESDQVVTKISGECPICGEETDQYLLWVIKRVSHAVPDPETTEPTYMHNQ